MENNRYSLNNKRNSKIPIRQDLCMSIPTNLESPSKSRTSVSSKRMSMISYTSRIPVSISSLHLNSEEDEKSQSYLNSIKKSTNIFSPTTPIGNEYETNMNTSKLKYSVSSSQLSKFSDLSLSSSKRTSLYSSRLPLKPTTTNIEVPNTLNNKSTTSSHIKFNHYINPTKPSASNSQSKLIKSTTLSDLKIKRRSSLKSESNSDFKNSRSTYRLSLISTITESPSSSTLTEKEMSKTKVHDIIELFELICNYSSTKSKFEICLNQLENENNNPNKTEAKCYAFEDLSSKRPDMFEKLTMYERIMQYPKIYFTGLPKMSKIKTDLKNGKNNHEFDDNEGNYKILEGDHIKYKYEIQSILGSGAFGSVISAIDHSDIHKRLVACKIIKNDPRRSLQAVEEIKILKQLKHPNILEYIEHFNFRSHMCIITELLGITLYESIQASNYNGFSLGIVKRFTKDILKGLNYLHERNIIHCDLKPENLMLSSNGTIKIIDFGSSCYKNNLKFSYLQSRFYRSPEVLLGGRYNEKMDIWSLGLISIELFAGQPLFQPQNEWELFKLCVEYLNVPSRKLILKLREEINKCGFIGIDNNNLSIAQNTLLWKAFDSSGGINMEYMQKQLHTHGNKSDKRSMRFKPGAESLKNFLRKHMDYSLSATDETVKELNNFLKFLKLCLVWNKWGRGSASECLQSEFFGV